MAPYVLGKAVDSIRDGKPTSRLLIFAGLTVAIQLADSALRFITRVFVSGSSRRVEYDLESTIKKIRAIPDLENFLGERLRTGQ